MTRSLRLAAAIAVVVPVLGLTERAHAELPNGAMLTFDMLKIHEDGGSLQQPSTDDKLERYLNLAHCACSKANAGMETTLSYQVRLSMDTNTNRPLEFFVGTDCDDDLQRPNTCRSIGSIGDIDTLVISPQDFEFSLFDVINGVNVDMACRPVDGGTASLWAMVDTDGDTNYDHTEAVPVGKQGTVTGFDTQPPPVPSNFVGSSAEGAIRLEWDPPTTTADIEYYQAFCAKEDGTPGRPNSGITKRYQTATDVCGLPLEIGLTPTELGGSGTPVDPAIPDGFASLDSAFLCGEDTTTARGMLIRGLENEVPYRIALVVVDKHGNVAGVSFNQTITPRAVTDFWEDLHDRGSNVEGGFCLTGAVGRGTAGGVGAIILALAFGLRRRGRRSRALTAAPLVIVAATVVPRPALAQDPYWVESAESSSEAIDEEYWVNWHVGLRFGPYTPEIDKQLGLDPGPYEEMFGGSRVLPMLDVDRIVWRGFGQLGFGGSIGYLQKTANAFTADSVPGSEDRMRSSGDENTFRLMPINATVIYRLTVLDDLYGIPVVPYARAGLGYYLWWLRTNGETSKACWDGTHTDGCDADKAIGATLGFVATAGIAIRAERVDADTALSMRTSGIEHAGFFAEIQMAKINGFGVDEKLSVGDTTWFIGADFEF